MVSSGVFDPSGSHDVYGVSHQEHFQNPGRHIFHCLGLCVHLQVRQSIDGLPLGEEAPGRLERLFDIQERPRSRCLLSPA